MAGILRRSALTLAGLLLAACSDNSHPVVGSPTPASTPVPATNLSVVKAPPSPTTSPATTPEDRDSQFTRLYSQGYDLVLSRDYEHGIPLLLSASKLRPDDPDLNFWLFSSYSKTDPKKAVPYVKKVARLMAGRPQGERAQQFLQSALPAREIEALGGRVSIQKSRASHAGRRGCRD